MIIILYFFNIYINLNGFSITPDIVNYDGNYIDRILIIKNRITCPCGARRDKIYENSSKFSNEEIIQNRQKIIKKLENDIEKKILTIDYLTKQLSIKK